MRRVGRPSNEKFGVEFLIPEVDDSVRIEQSANGSASQSLTYSMVDEGAGGQDACECIPPIAEDTCIRHSDRPAVYSSVSGRSTHMCVECRSITNWNPLRFDERKLAHASV